MPEKAEIVLSAKDQTAAAFATAKRNFDSLQVTAVGMAARLSAIAVGAESALAAFDRFNPKSIIDAGDELNKLTQKTGIAVETLSAYQYAGKLANVSNEELSAGLRKLNLNIAAAARGESEQAGAFRAMGVAVVDASGKVRSADKVFEDIADRMEGYNDGSKKNALANATLGKGFEALIPLLNGGKKGLSDARAELEKFGGLLTGDFAKKSEQFNDNMTKLGVASNALKVSIASGLIDRLVELSDRLVDAAKNGGLLAYSFQRIGEVLSGQASREFFFGTAQVDQVSTAQKEVDQLTKRISELQGKLERDPKNSALIRQLALVQETANAAGQELEAVHAKSFQDFRASERAAADFSGPPKKKKDAPDLGGTSATDQALQLLKKNLDGQLQAIGQNLASEQDLLKFNETFVQQVYQTGNTSLAAFYTAQDELRRRNLEELRKAGAETIAAEEEYQSKLPADKTVERLESRNKIAAAKAKLAAAEREALQAGDLSKLERPAAFEAQQRQLDQFNATLQDIVDGGRGRAAELADIAARVEDARKLLTRSGDAPEAIDAKTAALRTQLLQQREFNLARDEFARITDRAGAAEEALALVQKNSGTGLLESERQLHALREQELAQLGKVLDATRAIAATNPLNEGLQKSLRDAELAYARLRDIVDPTKLRLDGAADNIGDAIANGLSRANTEGKTLRQTITGLGKSIFDIVEKELVTKPLAQNIGDFVKGTGGQGAGENLIGKLFGLNSPKTAAGGAETANLTASLAALQTTGADPATAALVRLQQALDAASGSVSGSGSGSGLTTGDFTRTDHGSVATSGEQSIADLFKNFDKAQSGATDSAKDFGKTATAAATDLVQLANAAGQGNSALSLLPRIISLIATAASSSGASGGGGGIGGFFASLFGGTSANAAGGAASAGFGSGAGFGNLDLGTFLHDGGIVGQAGTRRAIDPGAFAYAARYHRGGLAGLKPDEVPAVLMGGPKGRREEVLHASDPRHRDNGGGATQQVVNLTQNFSFSSPPDRSTQTQVAARALAGARMGSRNR